MKPLLFSWILLHIGNLRSTIEQAMCLFFISFVFVQNKGVDNSEADLDSRGSERDQGVSYYLVTRSHVIDLGTCNYV